MTVFDAESIQAAYATTVDLAHHFPQLSSRAQGGPR